MAKTTIENVKCVMKFKALTPVLKNWCRLHEYYVSSQTNDAAYWYNERTSIGLLAAAAWQERNWVALEEYSTRKINSTAEVSAGVPNDRSGRCDLFLGSTLGNAQFAIEAKHAWQSLG